MHAMLTLRSKKGRYLAAMFCSFSSPRVFCKSRALRMLRIPFLKVRFAALLIIAVVFVESVLERRCLSWFKQVPQVQRIVIMQGQQSLARSAWNGKLEAQRKRVSMLAKAHMKNAKTQSFHVPSLRHQGLIQGLSWLPQWLSLLS